jgi:antitoxin (DNA-binding transcriptional repressor) of toxin-antitoxin stability system
MKMVNMHEAKRQLSGLVRELREGTEREIIICVAGQATAKLVPIRDAPPRQLGIDRGLITIAPDFEDVNVEITALFGK